MRIRGDVSVNAQVVVNCVRAGESAIDEMNLAEVKDIVAVVVVAGDYGLYVSHFTELGKEAGIEA